MTRPAGLVGLNIERNEETVPLPEGSLRALEALSSQALDPVFWRPERLGTPSAWWQHVPFAHWVVGATSPRTLVELGTYNGVSYSAFCHAVERNGLDTRCYAVDHWRGDPHAGEYGDDVLADLRQFHDNRYGAFSTLLRCAFDEALDSFPDASIDLLHIDGFHSYDAVSHDFESWRPKLSDRAVVLFHDTNELGADFGVWRLWSELRQRHPSFEFLHGHGLGVLAVGIHVPPAIAGLCAITEASEVAAIRLRLARLGERWEGDARDRIRVHEAAQARAEAAQARVETAAAQEQLRAIYQSTSWRLLEPAHRLGGRHPRLARLVRRGLKLVWWSVTLQLVGKLRERRVSARLRTQHHLPSPDPTSSAIQQHPTQRL